MRDFVLEARGSQPNITTHGYIIVIFEVRCLMPFVTKNRLLKCMNESSRI